MTNSTGWEMIIPFLRPLEPYLVDVDVCEVMVNGNGSVFIERGGLLEVVEGAVIGAKALVVAIKNIARRLGDDVSDEKPVLDSRLPDGSRLCGILPPVSIGGPTFCLRKFNHRKFDIGGLAAAGMLSAELSKVLVRAVRDERRNILISGATSSGKSTLLNALADQIDPGARIVVIEETCELQLSNQTNIVRLEAKRGLNGQPGVTVRELLRATLRLRPDRILLGEVRGGEAWDLLQLLNTGHSGTISTLHATSARQAVDRFASCVLESNVGLPHRAIRSTVGNSLNLIVQLERRNGKRIVGEVLRIGNYDPDQDRYDFETMYQVPVGTHHA